MGSLRIQICQFVYNATGLSTIDTTTTTRLSVNIYISLFVTVCCGVPFYSYVKSNLFSTLKPDIFSTFSYIVYVSFQIL